MFCQLGRDNPRLSSRTGRNRLIHFESADFVFLCFPSYNFKTPTC